MRRSQFFLPTVKEVPAEAQIISHQLMLRAGMVHQSAAGIYSWLPHGTRVLQNIENIVREEQDKVGAMEVIMPTIQSADLWRESGRYDAYGEEMLRIKDRHKRDMLYSPTAEEVVTDIARKHLRSYRDLPCILYQIHWKFRDEIRPRFGVMRGREFLMKDAYSLDLTPEEAVKSYQKMMHAYIRTFRRLGLTAVPVRAETGAIGGDLSHEFHIVAKTGESKLYYDGRLDLLMKTAGDVDVDQIMNLYAAADDLHDATKCPVPEEQLRYARGIEIGHVFYFGTKYSAALNAQVMGKDGELITPYMGSYGIGVSRLVGAIIEASNDEHGIIWPVSVAPFKVGLININTGNDACVKVCDELYSKLRTQNVSVLYDDRDERGGAKFAEMDLIGLPWQIRVGPKGLANNQAELKNRATGDTQELSLESLMTYLTKQLGL
jgi:prolyl-tRNA synthetase